MTQKTIKENFTEGKIHKENKMAIGLLLVAAVGLMIALSDKNVDEAQRKFYGKNLDKLW